MSEQIICDFCGAVWNDEPPVFSDFQITTQSPDTFFYTRFHGHICKECEEKFKKLIGKGFD